MSWLIGKGAPAYGGDGQPSVEPRPSNMVPLPSGAGLRGDNRDGQGGREAVDSRHGAPIFGERYQSLDQSSDRSLGIFGVGSVQGAGFKRVLSRRASWLQVVCFIRP